MLSLRLSKIYFSLSNLVPTNNPTQVTTGQKDKYRKYRKKGPELQISKILIFNGILHHKQILRNWRQHVYQKKRQNIQIQDYFPNLRYLKVYIKRMMVNGKIKSKGYDKKNKLFRGWQVNKERSLKWVHPQVKEQIQEVLRKRTQL